MHNCTDIPPFPDDIPTEQLSIIDYQLLLAGEPSEIEKLYHAAATQGFWYVKNHGMELLVNAMFRTAEKVLNLPLKDKLELLQRDHRGAHGYKAKGTVPVDQHGTRDITEFINISQDDVLAYPTQVHRTYPAPLREAMEDVVQPLVRGCVAMNLAMLAALTGKLQLPNGTLARLHAYAAGAESCSELRCLRTSPCQESGRIALGAHTDFGSLSAVFNRLGGLQILCPTDGTWKYVKPLPGHIICNVGDALEFFSGGLLRSSVHRVLPPPGLQAQHERWSIVYFTRPADDVELRPLAEESSLIAGAAKAASGSEKLSPGFTAGEWYAKKTAKYLAREHSLPT
ncbi:Clavaminate synthase-like protein [Gloeophyllum trabeum ATCC 11539]|uniref:Clavaminate synthase-like protein n=1 Tax=Gloeophyllum trabeum (strain ATCC 11539 / FP-39264 / Madison 617) TaxID=670483 RepID=S7RWU6_GLOTA|nr:Clavaminate synthase-like protein [Gloeophyllum trabeum ATCC 11539]EPQ57829.1 Clavaminate synthase-like protein [Gloeophyllum trabeum ATCC 11539]